MKPDRAREPGEAGRADALAPEWSAPFDVDAAIATAPNEGRVRGTFFELALQRTRTILGARLEPTVFHDVGWYPMREYLRLLVRCAEALHPDVPLREGLRRLGLSLYGDLVQTLLGRAIFEVAGRDFERIAMLAPRGYATAYDPVDVRTRMVGPRHLQVDMRTMHVLADTFHVGAWEGAARFCGVEPTLLVARDAPGRVALSIRWR